ncbi:MAG: C2H2-type zinc finger protein [Thermoplasmata archaeon]
MDRSARYPLGSGQAPFDADGVLRPGTAKCVRALRVAMPYVEYDEVQAICSECGRLFRSEEALEEHRSSVHGIGEEPRPPRRGPRSTSPAAPER